MLIRSVSTKDVPSLTDIYNNYIENTIITFEEDSITSNEMAVRIDKVSHAHLPWLVLEEDGDVLGYAYAGNWHGRSAYRFTAEPTIYLAQEAKGKGQGKILYSSLIEELRKKGMKQLIGLIALPNAASVGLHESLGFKKAGEFKDVGFKFDQWISVGYWQLTL
ncbi:Phosphinothricin N-acetyltransferase [Marinomonas spartinae]|uniref:Phosphinothricin N-acetyltransferase n=1 Tax=Marinomonas spartinae TaxID=1792290 RepID=A0A1A8TDS5_9GAMM|nr:GNAT family N-acetyltransferase [Marinomonas spartinae]SBS31000.1 Phosphinothricin N-acetyltransferase [Marinomonas spartinae]SBS33182.1 Phosphinothricin N-acetyltransferase [Marinomonas spartinae]